MSLKLYGLKNCDTCKKAVKWLQAEGIDHEFLDLRKSPPSPEQLSNWLKEVGSEKLINRRGTTWRKLGDEQQALADGESALALISEHDALMKRPIWETGDRVMVGFSKAEQEELQKLK
jgi:arsenate reductase